MQSPQIREQEMAGARAAGIFVLPAGVLARATSRLSDRPRRWRLVSSSLLVGLFTATSRYRPGRRLSHRVARVVVRLRAGSYLVGSGRLLRVGGLGSFAVLMALAGFAPRAVAQPFELPPVALETPGPNAVTYSQFPRAAIGGDGTAAAVWEHQSTTTEVHGAIRRPGQPGFDAEVTLSLANGTNATSPSVALDAKGRGYAVWLQGGGVYAATVSPAGFGSPKQIGAPGHGAQGAVLALSSTGSAVIAWYQDPTLLGAKIEVAAGDDKGDFTSNAVLSYTAGGTGDPPAVGVDDAGDDLVVFQQRVGLQERLEAANTTPDGEWTTPTVISDVSMSSAQAPVAAMNGRDDAVVAWQQNNGSGSDNLITAAIRPANGSFSAPQSVSAAGVDADSAAVALSGNGDAILLWRSLESNNVIRGAVSSALGPFGSPFGLSDPSVDASNPRVALDAGVGATAVWQQVTGSNSSTILGSVRGPYGFGPPFAVADAGESAGEPDLAMDPSGDALAVWQSENANTFFIRARFTRLPQRYGLQVEGIEMTQGVQKSDDAGLGLRDFSHPSSDTVPYGGVPLVAGRTTYARVFADAPLAPPGGVPGVQAVLYGYQGNGAPLDSSPITPMPPSSGDGSLTLDAPSSGPADHARATAASSDGAYDFQLPADWTTQGPIILRAELTGPDGLVGTADFHPCQDTDCQAQQHLTLSTIFFQPARTVTIGTFALDWTKNGDVIAPDDPSTVFDVLHLVYPVADGGMVVLPYQTSLDVTSAATSADPNDNEWLALNGALMWTQLFYRYGATFPGANADAFVGVNTGGAAPAPAWGLTNFSSFTSGRYDFYPQCCHVGTPASVVDENRPLTSVAHEVGHALGVAAGVTNPVTGRVDFLPHAGLACGGGDSDNDGDNWVGDTDHGADPDNDKDSIASDTDGGLLGLGRDEPPDDPNDTQPPLNNGDGGEGQPWQPDGRGHLDGLGFNPEITAGSSGLPLVLAEGGSPDKAGSGGDPSGQDPAGEYFDFMSYCSQVIGGGSAELQPGQGDSWISPANWTRLEQGFEQSPSASADTASARAVPGSRTAQGTIPPLTRGPSLLITAVKRMPGAATIGPVLPVSARDSSVASSEFHAVLSDAAGNVLADAPMSASVGHSDRRDRSGAGASRFESLVATLPAVPGSAMATITDRGVPVASVKRSPHAPVVKLLSPHRGSRVGGKNGVSVRWSARDVDNDSLIAFLGYSGDDGRSWRLIFAGPSSGRASLPSRYLFGSKRARLQLTVSDGFNATTVVSKRFTALGAPPQALIITPRAHLRVRADDPVSLAGTAIDDQGRQLKGTALRWFAGRRRLGHGARLTVHGLPAGRVTITLVSTDRSGRSSRSRVVIRVVSVAPLFLVLKVVGHRRAVFGAIRLRVAASVPATLIAGRTRARVGRRARTITIHLRRPQRAGSRLHLLLRADGRVTRTMLTI